MKITRRRFIVAAPVVAGAISGMQGVALGQQKTGDRDGLQPILEKVAGDPLSRLTWASFYPYQGTEFLFSGIGGNASLVLETMANTKQKDLEGISVRKGECFVLTFTDTSGIPLKEGTYDISHFRLGNFRLFITQGGRANSKNYYIAVINRVIS